MAISKEVDYVDGTTAVSAAWLNLLQEHLAGWVNVQVTAAGQVVTVAAVADDGIASVYVDGEMRYVEADITFTFTGSEATDTFEVYATADTGDDAFALEVTNAAPVATKFRLIAEVDYDTTLDVITDLRVVRGRVEEHDHSATSGAGEIDHADVLNPEVNDDHAQYAAIDGARAYTGVVTGVAPTAQEHLVTKKYADDLVVSGGISVGTIAAFGGVAAPTGWLLCDGTSYPDATYPLLSAVMNDVYGGDASNFNVPDLRGSFPVGKAVTGPASGLGASGGALDHTHTQPTHTHALTVHTHSTPGHTHTNTSPVPAGGSHSHTQGTSGSESVQHTHGGFSHTHGSGYSLAATGTQINGIRHPLTSTPGLFQENDLDQGASSSSHLHGNGGYYVFTAGDVTGSTASASAGHAHPPALNGKAHTHNSGAIGGASGAAGTGATTSSGAHTHSNPTTAVDANHDHTVAATGSATPVTAVDVGGTSSAAGDQTSGVGNPPFQVVQYIVRHD